MKFQLLVTLTWSKIMAFCILGSSFALDLIHGDSKTITFAIPFISALILGKQYFDKAGSSTENSGKDEKP
jgi:hypothetical protein